MSYSSRFPGWVDTLRSQSVASRLTASAPFYSLLPLALLPLILSFISNCLIAADWPQWRGPDRNGVSPETGLLKTWESPPPVIWRADQIGDGYSSLAVAEGRVFTLGRHGSDVHCVALDLATGA